MNCRGSLDPAGSLNTLPVPLTGQEVPYQTRYVFAYGMDNSDRPCYLLWPIRGGNGQFLLVDPWSGNYFDLEAAKFVKPIGIEHFFDAFSLEKKRPLKIDAASAHGRRWSLPPARNTNSALIHFGEPRYRLPPGVPLITLSLLV